MQKNLLFVVLLCSCFITKAQTISKDKPLHFGAGFGIGAVGGYTAHQLFDGDPYWYWAGAVGSSFAAGMVKESMDKSKYGIWDSSDVLFTTLGGIASGFVLDLFLKKSRKRRKSKSCDCYALEVNLPKTDAINFYDISISSSRDITSSIQAQRILEMQYLAILK